VHCAKSHRRCIATGDIHDRSSLLRFVVGPNGELVADTAARLPGRGLWLTPRRDILERAIARRLFARSAHRAIITPADFADRVETLLVQRCVDGIGLGRRAGLAVAGFERACEAVRMGKATLLFLALDGAEGGRLKMRALARGLPIVIVLTATEMGAIFGRDHVVNIAIGDGRLSGRLIAVAEKIAGFRPGAVIDRGVDAAPGRSAWQDTR
jgi:predicted RNA-binding protein YlxR (DUF448 family)/ribosomal protein L30E